MPKLKSKIIKLFLFVVCVLTILLTAKFYLGFYEFHDPPHKSIFVKHKPIWKSTFYSPLNRENKTYNELTIDEEYEQSMFMDYASSQILRDLELINCGDLFSKFAKKPNHLEYIGCERFSDSQTIIAANYRVAGKNAVAVEDYLIKNHKMPPMKIFQHTGYEPAGFGTIDVDVIKNIHPYMDIYIDMGGYARKELSYDKNGKEIIDFSLLPKHEVPYFYVKVSIMVI